MSDILDFPEDERKPSRGEAENESGESIVARLPKLSYIGRIGSFYNAIKLEMRNTTWPNRSEVWNTTVVVLIALVFFGFYLWGVDMLITLGFDYLEKAVK